MKANKIDGVIHIELSDGVIHITEEELAAQLQRTEEVKKYINKWLDLYGGQSLSIKDVQELDTDFYTRMEIFYDEARKYFEAELKSASAPAKIISGLNLVLEEVISVYKRQLEIPGITQKGKINYQIKTLEGLQAFIFKVHMALQGEREMADLKNYTNFFELVGKFGNSEQLKKEYNQQFKNAPSKKLMIERQISALVGAKDVYSSNVHFWHPTPQDIIKFDFGEYYRIGFEWMIAGHNATWRDLDVITLRNISLNAVIPAEKRTEAYVILIHQLIKGGALAIHIAFLYGELDSVLTVGSKKIIGFQRTTHKIHFEDFSGQEFERLALAYLQRLGKYGDSLKWYGESGSDGGRDIWGEEKNETWCFQCANYQTLTFDKIRKDIDKLKKGDTIPLHYVVIAGGKVSAGTQKKIINYCKEQNIEDVDIWTGAEFQEKLQSNSPDLLKRWCEGDAFPDI
jgi:hypothetical protein